MERIGWAISNLFKIPFLIVAFFVYLPIYILDMLWNSFIEEKTVPVKIVSR